MAKVLSKSVLYIGQGIAPATAPGADTFDTIGNLTALSGPEFSKDEIEHTDMDSTSKEFFGDLPNPGSINFTANRNFGDAGQSAARADVLQQVQRNIRVERLDPANDAVLETVDFVGEVMEWTEDAGQASVFTITGRIKISGDVTIT
jgi:hypothetical protein